MFLECDATPSQLELNRQSKAVRQRLMSPPKAIRDLPIELKRPEGILGYQANKNAQEALEKAKDTQKLVVLEIQTAQIAAIPMPPRRDWLFIAMKESRDFQFPPNFLHEILATTAVYFSISQKDIRGPDRHPHFVRPRQIVVWLARKFTDRSYPQIMKMLGGRDHTTGVHGVEKINELLKVDVQLKKSICELTDIFEQKLAEWRKER